MSSFHASNNRYGTPPSMLHDIPRGKQEQRRILISALSATPYLKTHVAGEYTKTHTAGALMQRQANTQT